MNRQKWTDKDTHWLLAHYEKGGRYCGQVLKRDPASVRSKIQKLGLNTPRDEKVYWSPEQKEFLRLHYSSKGASFCAKKLRRNLNSIYTKAKSLSLSVDPVSLRYRRTLVYRENHLCPVKKDPFVNVKTPEAAYLLGFIWADGHVNMREISISIQKEDMEVLEPIFSTMGEWGRYERQRANRKPQIALRTTNKELSQYLIDKSYGSKSYSSACRVLETIPQELWPYWFRGLVDGDGSVPRPESDATLTISSGIEQDWAYLISLSLHRDLSFKIDRYKRLSANGKYHSSSIFRFRATSSIAFLDYVYGSFEQDRIGLTRKYDRYVAKKARIAAQELKNIL